MSKTPWWAVAIQWTLWAVVMTVVMGWLGRSRLQRRFGEDPGTLRHPTSTLIMGVIGFCLFAACAVLSALSRNGTAPWWVSTGFAVGAAMSAAMVLDYFMARHRVSDDGLAYRKLFGATGFIRWSELTRVRYGSTMKWFRLDSRTGEIVRISVMLTGLPGFADALLKGAPPDSFDAETREILEATAEGLLPPVWG